MSGNCMQRKEQSQPIQVMTDDDDYPRRLTNPDCTRLMKLILEHLSNMAAFSKGRFNTHLDFIKYLILSIFKVLFKLQRLYSVQ
jgi:hypothetical protein